MELLVSFILGALIALATELLIVNIRNELRKRKAEEKLREEARVSKYFVTLEDKED